MSGLVEDLATEIDRLTQPRSGGCGCEACLRVAQEPSEDAVEDARSDVLAALSDAQVKVLLDLICNEGLERGWGSWWWE